MMSAANQDAYGSPGWNAGRNQGPWETGQGPQGPQQPNGGQPWGYRPWSGPPFWHPDGISRPAAIAFTILGFMFWWPVGLALLIYMVGSGRMGCFGRRRRAMYQQYGQDGGPWSNWKAWACGPSAGAAGPAATSGNRAFDEYKAETLRRMEEEQKDFGAFLDRLRFAKDKSEFDQFMAERRTRPPAPPQPDEQPPA
jgi:hypothetical protein